MAKNIVQAFRFFQPDVIVALAGNVHSNQQRGTSWDPEFKPMGYELLAQENSPFNSVNTFNIKIRHEGGSAWVCLDGDCGPHDLATIPSPYSVATPFDHYFLRENEAYDGYSATLFVRRLSVSMPF